ncbi:MAG: hypothetical protein ACQKBT_13150 [Puniceicoccales bacterium]
MKPTDCELDDWLNYARKKPSPGQPDPEAVAEGFELRLSARIAEEMRQPELLLSWRWALTLLSMGVSLWLLSVIFLELALGEVLLESLSDAWIFFL